MSYLYLNLIENRISWILISVYFGWALRLHINNFFPFHKVCYSFEIHLIIYLLPSLNDSTFFLSFSFLSPYTCTFIELSTQYIYTTTCNSYKFNCEKILNQKLKCIHVFTEWPNFQIECIPFQNKTKIDQFSKFNLSPKKFITEKWIEMNEKKIIITKTSYSLPGGTV